MPFGALSCSICTQQSRCATNLTHKHMASYQELLSQKATLDAQAAELAAKLDAARAEEKQGAIALIKELMARNDVRLSDLGTPRSKSARAARPASASTKPNPLSGKKIPAKYCGVDEEGKPAAWSGRGLQPKWLSAAIAAGCKLEDFRVTA